ncbi:MAG: cysteine desulfurase-like protein [Nakamurella sp.]
MAFDVSAIRAHFPSLATGIAFFDGPGGTQTPDAVGDAIRDTIIGPLSNRGSVTESEQRAEAVVVDARQAMADLLGADPQGIVFGRSATALHYIMSRALAKTWDPGDEIVVSRLDHDSNVRPWIQAAEAAGATVKWIDFDPETTELTVEHVAASLSDKTRLVAVTGASNLIGTRPDIAAIAALVHGYGALLSVDGVHLTAHASIDVPALGADFYSCSPYKFLGPHCGVLAADPELLETLDPDKLLPATNAVPEKFEFGTLPYELLAGITAAVDFLAGLDSAAVGSCRERLVASFAAVGEHEDSLLERLEAGLAALPGVTVWSRAGIRTPTLLLTFDGRDSVDVYRHLATAKINAPASSFYALETSRRLGLGDTGGLRVGLAPYNTAEEVDRLLAALGEFLVD